MSIPQTFSYYTISNEENEDKNNIYQYKYCWTWDSKDQNILYISLAGKRNWVWNKFFFGNSLLNISKITQII